MDDVTGFMLKLLLVTAGIAGLIIWRSVSRERRGQLVLATLAERWAHVAGPNSLLVGYDGGHPALASTGQVALRAGSACLEIVRLSGEVIPVPFESITAIAFDSNLQNVNIGGGRSIGGAVVGDLLFGPVGAIVGGRSGAKIQRFDESRTVITMQHGKMQVQVLFRTTSEVHARIAGLLK